MVQERDVSLRHLPNVSMSFQSDIASTSFPGEISQSFNLHDVEDTSFQIPTDGSGDLLLDVDDDFFRAGREHSIMATPRPQSDLTLSQLTPSPRKSSRKSSRTLAHKSTPLRRSPRKHIALLRIQSPKRILSSVVNKTTPEPSEPVPSPSRFDSLRAELQTLANEDASIPAIKHTLASQENESVVDDSPDKSGMLIEGAAGRLLLHGNALLDSENKPPSRVAVDAAASLHAVTMRDVESLTPSAGSSSRPPPSPMHPATKRLFIFHESDGQEEEERPRKRINAKPEPSTTKPESNRVNMKRRSLGTKKRGSSLTTRAVARPQRIAPVVRSISSVKTSVSQSHSNGPTKFIAPTAVSRHPSQARPRSRTITQHVLSDSQDIPTVTSKVSAKNATPDTEKVTKEHFLSTAHTNASQLHAPPLSKPALTRRRHAEVTESTTSADHANPLPVGSMSNSSSSNGRTTRRIPPLSSVQDLHAVKAKLGLVPTVPVAPNFTIESRLRERKEFDERVKERERELERLKEEERRLIEEEEEKELKELRKRTVIKAHDVPDWYKDIPRRKD